MPCSYIGGKVTKLIVRKKKHALQTSLLITYQTRAKSCVFVYTSHLHVPIAIILLSDKSLPTGLSYYRYFHYNGLRKMRDFRRKDKMSSSQYVVRLLFPFGGGRSWTDMFLLSKLENLLYTSGNILRRRHCAISSFVFGCRCAYVCIHNLLGY